MKNISTLAAGVFVLMTSLLQNEAAAKQTAQPIAAVKDGSHCKKKCCEDTAYACATNPDPIGQGLDTNWPYIVFPENVVEPQGIIHPVAGDTSKFQVQEAGLYQIQWHLSARTSIYSQLLEVILVDGNDNPYTASYELQALASITDRTMSGQVILDLQTGSTLQMKAMGFLGSPSSPDVIHATMTITKLPV